MCTLRKVKFTLTLTVFMLECLGLDAEVLLEDRDPGNEINTVT